ncbi:membrane protein [Janthinobacterium sp. RA13]|uniref:membrane protein n=1 Tax=Janthinobacterium sp. RA13 TaxID=1502762 RepID=UPI00055EB80F|nr:membrane protein [Janthinobacterium sp. RA13]
MRTAIFLLLASASLGAHGAARTPFQVRCEDTISKTVSVLTAQQNGYSIDTHLPYKALTVMKGMARANTWVLGLTKTDSRVAIALAGPMLQDPASGYECVAPQITVSLTYAPVVLYIGREFAPGTCAYDEILAHELRHMKTYMEHLPRVEKTVRASLAKRFEARPLYAPSGTAKAALAREIDTGWLPYVKAEMRKVEALQAAIDSPQEYARLGKACKGEIQNILTGKTASAN